MLGNMSNGMAILLYSNCFTYLVKLERLCSLGFVYIRLKPLRLQSEGMFLMWKISVYRIRLRMVKENMQQLVQKYQFMP